MHQLKRIRAAITWNVHSARRTCVGCVWKYFELDPRFTTTKVIVQISDESNCANSFTHTLPRLPTWVLENTIVTQRLELE